MIGGQGVMLCAFIKDTPLFRLRDSILLSLMHCVKWAGCRIALHSVDMGFLAQCTAGLHGGVSRYLDVDMADEAMGWTMERWEGALERYAIRVLQAQRR